ncbi:MAG: gliding motility-associated C-terminal domain-containing protein, partial [Saprospiraceae bacterium]|nr:gliding motility-associated C-terminal domain-containing protein [Saprospiraceae bacterium]
NLNSTVDFTDLSLEANRWNWQFDRYATSNLQNPTFTFPDTGLMKIRLIVTHPRGCKDSLTKYLDIRPEIRWFMPNAFTPNGDGANDGFLGKGFLEGSTNFNMSVWNRWGEKVFETDDPTEDWNGRQMNTGAFSPAGVYVYVVTFTGPRKEKMEFKGFATLIR